MMEPYKRVTQPGTIYKVTEEFENDVEKFRSQPRNVAWSVLMDRIAYKMASSLVDYEHGVADVQDLFSGIPRNSVGLDWLKAIYFDLLLTLFYEDGEAGPL